MIKLTIEHPFIEGEKVIGNLNENEALREFADYEWREIYQKLLSGTHDEFYETPSMYFENSQNSTKINFSLVGGPEELDYLVVFTRIKTVSGFLGFGAKQKTVASDCDYGFENCKEILKDFIRGEVEALEARF